MKKFCTFLFTTALLCVSLSAQHGRPPQEGNLSFAAAGNEKFVVYVDGAPHSGKPSSNALVKDIFPGTHDVIVVLSKPEERAAYARIHVKPGPQKLTVSYSRHDKALHIEGGEPERTVPQPSSRPTPPTNDDRRNNPQHIPASPQPVADREVSEMANRLRTEPFNRNRLDLAKSYAASRPMTVSQLVLLAATIDLDNDRLEFLKYAYDYCLDPMHYNRTLDVLTFSSNRQNLLKHIEQKRKK